MRTPEAVSITERAVIDARIDATPLAVPPLGVRAVGLAASTPSRGPPPAPRRTPALLHAVTMLSIFAADDRLWTEDVLAT